MHSIFGLEERKCKLFLSCDFFFPHLLFPFILQLGIPTNYLGEVIKPTKEDPNKVRNKQMRYGCKLSSVVPLFCGPTGCFVVLTFRCLAHSHIVLFSFPFYSFLTNKNRLWRVCSQRVRRPVPLCTVPTVWEPTPCSTLSCSAEPARWESLRSPSLVSVVWLFCVGFVLLYDLFCDLRALFCERKVCAAWGYHTWCVYLAFIRPNYTSWLSSFPLFPCRWQDPWVQEGRWLWLFGHSGRAPQRQGHPAHGWYPHDHAEAHAG